MNDVNVMHACAKSCEAIGLKLTVEQYKKVVEALIEANMLRKEN